MSVTVAHTRKAVVVSYDKDKVKGHFATVLAANPAKDNEVVEKKEVANHGGAVLYFPSDYHGECHVVIRGSAGGEDEGTITV